MLASHFSICIKDILGHLMENITSRVKGAFNRHLSKLLLGILCLYKEKPPGCGPGRRTQKEGKTPLPPYTLGFRLSRHAQTECTVE